MKSEIVASASQTIVSGSASRNRSTRAPWRTTHSFAPARVVTGKVAVCVCVAPLDASNVIKDSHSGVPNKNESAHVAFVGTDAVTLST
jgi:hypothetical protein